jgi:glycosyltransferase involved in cell wall biosynthesis
MEIEYTFILPCLNEEKTIAYCIEEIKRYIDEKKINAEILVSDNNSTDNSINIAEKHGARVVKCEERGYGNALINGTNNAYGKYCIMGDSDGSYDFFNIDEFINGLKDGNDLIVGNRFKGGIEKDAMTLSHKIGVTFLSSFANLFFHTPIKDYHCGLRAYNKESIKALNLSQKGMEYASEMIIVAKINNLKLLEIPTVLRKDLRDRKSHLRTIRDGFRHLKLICNLAINKKKYIIKEVNFNEENN